MAKFSLKNLGKRKIAIIAAAALLVVAAAVAIPVGIVYGSPDNPAAANAPTNGTDPNGTKPNEDKATTQPTSMVLPERLMTYGNIIKNNPDAPVDPNGSSGYTGSYGGAKIRVQSSINEGTNPPVGSAVDFATPAGQQLNADTVVEVTFAYVAREGFKGNPFAIKQDFRVVPATVAYTGAVTYEPAKIAYGSATGIAFRPDALPDVNVATNGDKFVFDNSYGTTGVTYFVSKTVGGVPYPDTTSLDGMDKWPAGVEITATYRFTPKPNYAASNTVTVKRVYTISKAVATATPATTEEAASFATGFAPPKPAAPQKVTGYTGVFKSAIVTKAGNTTPKPTTDISAWLLTSEDNDHNLNKFPPGTEFKVTYTYTLDQQNYEGTPTVESTQIFTVTQH